MRAFFSIPALGALLGILLLDVVVWLFAPLLGEAFDAIWLRGILVGIPILLWAVIVFLMGRKREGRDSALVEAAAAPDPKIAKDEHAAAEEAELRGKLTEALAKLKAATGGKGTFLYDLPWYAIIGPPGSGKTTALMNSGLEFPLAEGRVAGVGGTRFCDWWLSERAVMIDTAGRYTTQDSDADADKAGWERFLDLVKKNRPRQPLNGVLVAFGVDMLSRLDATQRESHARSVRRRIKELETRLGQRLPVYFLVSKTDLLPGFTEFFDDLDKAGRDQVWGFTFPVAATPEGAVQKFGEEFKALEERLTARLLERLQAERGPSQRALIAGFPAQVASLEGPLQAFVQAAFGGSKLDPAPFLRGVYFTSGTQEGTPLDRLSGALSRAFGLDPKRPAAVMGQKGRAYFLGRLLKDVVFNEARLAANDRGLESRRRMVQLGAWAAAILLLVGGGAWGFMALETEATRERRLTVAVTAAEAAATNAEPLERVPSPDLTRVLGYLEATRALPEAAKGDGPAFGLSQEEMLSAGADSAYRRALDRVLLPRLLARVEAQIRQGIQRPDFLYEAVRVYLMLGKQGPMDRTLVKEWFGLDWQAEFPGAVNQPGRDALGRHLDALLAGQLAAYPLDGALVDQARRVFSRLPMAQRVYTRLRPLAENIPAWTPAQPLGAAGQRYFTRSSGRPLTEGVPGLFTVEGLYRAVLPRLPQAALEAASESWVLGPEAAVAGAGNPGRLEADVLALYAADYVRAWEAMLGDIVLPPFASLNAAAEGLNLLGAPNSPMKDLLRSIARQLAPGTAPEPPGGAAGAALAGAAAQAAQAATAAASRVAAAVGANLGGSGAKPVADVVEPRFRELREAAGAPLDGVLAILNDLYVQVARLANSPPGTALPPTQGLDPGQRLLSEAQRQPQPLQGWMTALAQSTGQARAGGAQAAIAAAGGQQLAPLCRGMETRFPFRRANAAPDMPMDDFIRLFAPGGLFDTFFTANIRNYADTTQRPWRPVAADGLPPPISPADLVQFQRAAAIRDAFFPTGGNSGFRFQLVPQGLSAGTTAGVLEASGNRVALTPGGGGRPVDVSFPAQNPVTLTFDPESSAGPLAYDGAWATLRFVFLGRLNATAQPDRFRLSVTQGDKSADFLVQASSSVNPFGLRELLEFRCPTLRPN
ncbi:type VI secretion system membrane subunit TssM [Humitalea sp. 24SJ18S-53]|uniref:type VI secretion system membrane subunit TssM n=1 Tax=Humitalea sp. 24SJ18S-53 TaxID=3422307 RepID=UPI003D672790